MLAALYAVVMLETMNVSVSERYETWCTDQSNDSYVDCISGFNVVANHVANICSHLIRIMLSTTHNERGLISL